MPSILVFLKDVAEGAAKKIGENLGGKLSSLFAHNKNIALDAANLRFIGEALEARLLREGFEAKEAQRAGESLIVVLVSNPKLVRDIVAG